MTTKDWLVDPCVKVANFAGEINIFSTWFKEKGFMYLFR